MSECRSHLLCIPRNRYPGRWRKRLFALPILGVALLAAGCNLQATGEDSAVVSTLVAYEVQATMQALQGNSPDQPAEVGDTQAEPPPPVPPTSEPQPVEPSPTETAGTVDLELPVDGSLNRADYDPAANWGGPHDAESFDGSRGLFPATSAGAANAWYADGKYNIKFTTRGRWTWYWSFIEPRDFYADVVIINGDQCVYGDTAGMVVRGNSVQDFGIMFGISCGGEYFIGVTLIPGAEGLVCTFDNGDADCINRELTRSEFIDPGPGAVNRLGVMAKGGDLDFYINGRWVDSTSLGVWSNFLQQGNLALYLGTAQQPDAAVKFDDFSIWYLD